MTAGNISRMVCLEKDGDQFYIRHAPGRNCKGKQYESYSPPSVTDDLFWPKPEGPYTREEVKEWIKKRKDSNTRFPDKHHMMVYLGVG